MKWTKLDELQTNLNYKNIKVKLDPTHNIKLKSSKVKPINLT